MKIIGRVADRFLVPVYLVEATREELLKAAGHDKEENIQIGIGAEIDVKSLHWRLRRLANAEKHLNEYKTLILSLVNDLELPDTLRIAFSDIKETTVVEDDQ